MEHLEQSNLSHFQHPAYKASSHLRREALQAQASYTTQRRFQPPQVGPTKVGWLVTDFPRFFQLSRESAENPGSELYSNTTSFQNQKNQDFDLSRRLAEKLHLPSLRRQEWSCIWNVLTALHAQG